MPTKPQPIPPPVDEEEKLAREFAQNKMEQILNGMRENSYGMRSNMPGYMDYTNFLSSLDDVATFCKGRPDLLLKIVGRPSEETKKISEELTKQKKYTKMYSRGEDEARKEMYEWRDAVRGLQSHAKEILELDKKL